MERKLQLLESFHAEGSDGKTYKVCGYEQMAADPTLQDGQPHWQSTGVAEYRLAEGDVVEVRKDGVMRVRNSGVELRRA